MKSTLWVSHMELSYIAGPDDVSSVIPRNTVTKNQMVGKVCVTSIEKRFTSII
jgi:hypothetical protein